MAWSTSNMNAYYAYGMGTNLVKPSTDSFKVALYGNTVTPAQSATEAVTEYAGAAQRGRRVTRPVARAIQPVAWLCLALLDAVEQRPDLHSCRYAAMDGCHHHRLWRVGLRHHGFQPRPSRGITFGGSQISDRRHPDRDLECLRNSDRHLLGGLAC